MRDLHDNRPASDAGLEDGAPGEVEQRSLAGVTIDGRYLLEERIAVGGLGEIYRGRHVRMNRAFAVKLLQPSVAAQPDFLERFDREAQALSKLDHPCCVAVTDYGVSKEHGPYIVMELVDGVPLSTYTRGEGLALQTALELASKVLVGLQHAHEKGIVHRDIKPDNIMIVEPPLEPGRLLPKILDFGLAKIRAGFGSPEGKQLTQVGFIVGTPSYLAPERVTNPTGADDVRSDIYAVGVILFELCCGCRPFVGEDMVQLMDKHLRQPPPAPRSLRPELPPELEAAILRALEKRPEDRFPTAVAFRDALDALLPLPSTIAQRQPHHRTATASATRVERPSPRLAPTSQPATGRRWLLRATVAGALLIVATTLALVGARLGRPGAASGVQEGSVGTKVAEARGGARGVKPTIVATSTQQTVAGAGKATLRTSDAEPDDRTNAAEDDSTFAEAEMDAEVSLPPALHRARRLWSSRRTRRQAARQFMQYLARHRHDAAAHVAVGRLYLYALWSADGIKLVQRGLRADPGLHLDMASLVAVALAYRGPSLGPARGLIDAHAAEKAPQVLLVAAAVVRDLRIKHNLLADVSRRGAAKDPLSQRLLELAQARSCEQQRRAVQLLPDPETPVVRVMLLLLRSSRCLSVHARQRLGSRR
jgi:serine/threonine protein kinase